MRRGRLTFIPHPHRSLPAPFSVPCHLGLPLEFVDKGTLSNTSWPFCLLANLIESTLSGWWKAPNAEFKEEIDFSKLAFWWHWLNCFLFSVQSDSGENYGELLGFPTISVLSIHIVLVLVHPLVGELILLIRPIFKHEPENKDFCIYYITIPLYYLSFTECPLFIRHDTKITLLMYS